MLYCLIYFYVYIKSCLETDKLKKNINENELKKIGKINKQIIKNNTFTKYLNKLNLWTNILAILSIIFTLIFYILSI
jgi:hypothetical protein